MARVVLWACVLASVSSYTTAALSQSEEDDGKKKVRVVLVSMQTCCQREHWPEAEKAASEEIAALGFRVETKMGASTAPAAQRTELETIARANDAVCAVRVLRYGEGVGGAVDIWMIDTETTETTFRHLPLSDVGDSEAASFVVLRTVEAIRAGLLEQELPRTASEEPPPPEDSTNDKDQPELEQSVETLKTEVEEVRDIAPAFGAGLGAGVLGGPGGAGALAAVRVTLGWTPVAVFSAEIDGLISVFGQNIEQDRMSASFDAALVRLWGFWEILDHGPVRPSLGIGSGLAVSWSRGLHAGSLSTRIDSTESAYLGGVGRLGFVLAKYFWLRLDGRVGALLPGVTIAFAEDEIASFGRPLVEGFLSLEVRFP